jgi:hypothetical protein
MTAEAIHSMDGKSLVEDAAGVLQRYGACDLAEVDIIDVLCFSHRSLALTNRVVPPYGSSDPCLLWVNFLYLISPIREIMAYACQKDNVTLAY